MSVKYPYLLILLFLVPLFTWLRYRRDSFATMGFSHGEVLAKMPPTWTVAIHRMLPILYALGLISLILAMARPQQGLEESLTNTDVIDIALLVDVSGSMEALDFATRSNPDNRLDAAKKVIHKFIEMRPADRICLIGFAALPYMVSPLTTDHFYLIQQIDRLKIGMVDDGTGIGSALASGINHLRDTEAKSKVIILLTDGINNSGISPLNAAEAAKAMGIKVYTVGAGADGKVRFPYRTIFGQVGYRMEESKIDEETLTDIAKATGGQYFRAKDFNALEKVYEEINELERTEIEVDNYTRYEERFTPFAAAGVLLLLLEKLLALTRFGRLP